MNIRIGVSHHPQTRVAIREAIEATGQQADFVWIFASSHYHPDMLAEELRQAFGDIPMAGCSTSGELSTHGYSVESCVIVTIQSDSHRFGVSAIDGIRGNERHSGYACAKQALSQIGATEPKGVFVLLSDGLTSNQHDIIHGAYSFCGADIPIIGGAAADNRDLSRTYQIANGQVYTNAVVGIWVYTDESIGIGIGHGWRPTSRLLRVTKVEGSVVHQLDGRPAVEVYLESLGLTDSELSASRIATLGVSHPFGMISSEGQYEIRHVLEQQGNSIVCFGNIRDGSLVSVMTATEEDLLQASRRALEDAVVSKGSDSSLAIVFSCVARSTRLQARVSQEYETMAQACPEIPLIGFYTYGEFARYSGKVGFHNGTVVSLVL